MKYKKFLFLILLSGFTFNQIIDTNSYFSSTGTSLANAFSAGCWIPPTIPNLVYPLNNTIVGNGHAWLADPYMDWDNSTSTCPLTTAITYQYQACADSACSSVIYTSPSWFTDSQIPTPGLPDGVYYWHVRAKDNHGNTSAFSPPWKLTVDRVSPLVPTLQITGSYTKAIEEKIANGDFNTGDLLGWTTAGSVSVGSSESDNYAVIGNSVDPGNFIWDNRLMQSFDSGAKSLALSYNFFSSDYLPFDNPGFAIKLNGQEIFRLNPTAAPTGWQEYKYDLSEISTDKSNLAIYAGNTGDKLFQSWAYVDKITTYFVSAPLHATYHFDTNDPDIAYYRYQIDALGWQTLNSGETFTLPAGDHTIAYYAVDTAGNESGHQLVKINVDASPPSAVADLSSSGSTANTVTLNWTAPGNDGTSGRAASYDLRYSASPITAANFDAATRVNQIPSPQASGITESLTVSGLNPSTTYYFALKSADEAPNWSDISNIVSTATNTGLVINSGDIVINEIMWIGGTNPEQFIELRNTTDRNFPDLSLLELKIGDTILHNFSGFTLPAHGYLLLSNLNNSTTNIGATSIIDVTDVSMDLSRTLLDLSLEWNTNLLDIAWSFDSVTEGIFDTTPGAEKYYSMERTNLAGHGDDPLNWYTCIDLASSLDFFKTLPNVDFRGTPKADNRSENEPLAHLTPPRLTPTLTPTPTPTPVSLVLTSSYNSATNKIILDLSHLEVGNSLSYEIIYTNTIGEQGFVGSLNATNIPHDFYLGTCSANGTCVSDTGIGTTATVILTGSNYGLPVNLLQTILLQ